MHYNQHRIIFQVNKIYESTVNYMENDKQIVLDKLYEIIDAVERLDSAVENVSRMIIENLVTKVIKY